MRTILLTLLLTHCLLANIGTVMAMRGEAMLERHTGKTKALNIGTILIEGDAISTKAHSRVQVMLKDQTVVTIGSNSLFKFDEYFFDGSQKSKLKMEAKRGFFRSVSGKIGKIAPKRFSVKTTSATIGIRGTDFSVYLTGDKEYYRCFAGAITVTVDGEEQRLIPGDLIFLDKKVGKAKIKKHIGRQFRPIKLQGTLVEQELKEIDRVINETEIFQHVTPEGEPCTVEPK